MALIIMCCYDTDENRRSEYTEKTLKSLSETVNWDKNRLVVVDNGSCVKTKVLLSTYVSIGNTNLAGNFGNKIPGITVITNSENIGTSRAFNQGLALRSPGQNVCKIDNDVTIDRSGWVDELEEAIGRDQRIGILGLKRKDLIQNPYHENPQFKSEFLMLPHEPGQRWITVEATRDIMGTCTMFSSALIDKIGGSAQPGVYGLEDCLYCLRSGLAGFYNAFLPHIEIEHLDRGDNEYIQEKIKLAGEAWPIYHDWHKGYIDGTRSLYVEI